MRKWLLLILIGIFVFAISSCSTKVSVPKAEAEKIATTQLQEYCQRKGISPSLFPPPEVSSETGLPWVFDYTSNGLPRHLVRITIDEYGKIETSMMIDE